MRRQSLGRCGLSITYNFDSELTPDKLTLHECESNLAAERKIKGATTQWFIQLKQSAYFAMTANSLELMLR